MKGNIHHPSEPVMLQGFLHLLYLQDIIQVITMNHK